MNGSELVLNGFQGQITLKKIPHLTCGVNRVRGIPGIPYFFACNLEAWDNTCNTTWLKFQIPSKKNKTCLNQIMFEPVAMRICNLRICHNPKKKSTYLSDLSCFEWCWAVLSGQLPCCRSTFLPYIMIVHWSFELWTHPFQFPCPSSWAVGVGSLTRSGWTWRSVSPQSSHLSNLTT